MPIRQRIAPCLWIDDQAEEAVAFYTAIFRNSKVVKIARYGEAGHEEAVRTRGCKGTTMRLAQ